MVTHAATGLMGGIISAVLLVAFIFFFDATSAPGGVPEEGVGHPLNFLVVGDWGRRGEYNQSIVAAGVRHLFGSQVKIGAVICAFMGCVTFRFYSKSTLLPLFPVTISVLHIYDAPFPYLQLLIATPLPAPPLSITA